MTPEEEMNGSASSNEENTVVRTLSIERDSSKSFDHATPDRREIGEKNDKSNHERRSELLNSNIARDDEKECKEKKKFNLDYDIWEEKKNSDKSIEEITGNANANPGLMWRGKQVKKLKKYRALTITDHVLALIIVCPLAVGFWRGIWTLMDFYDLRGWPTFLTGTGVHLLFAILQHDLQADFTEKFHSKYRAKRLFYHLVLMLYIHLFGVNCNAQWRGGWMLFEEYIGTNIRIMVPFVCLFLSILAVFRCIRDLLAAPFLIFVDNPERTFIFPTRYNTNTRDWSLYILDCVFSVGVVGTLVVFVWRGVWILFDIYLFPDNREHTAIGSLIIGYVIVAVTFCLQPLMRYICSRLEGLARLIAADIFLLLSFVGTVNVWRGIWMSLDLWLLPDKPVLSCWITHLGCFLLLVLLNCSNSILVRGVYIDAEEDAGKCVVFPCHYLRLFFKIEREKKEARKRNLLMASKDLTGNADGSGKDPENGALLNSAAPTTILPANPESLV